MKDAATLHLLNAAGAATAALRGLYKHVDHIAAAGGMDTPEGRRRAAEMLENLEKHRPVLQGIQAAMMEHNQVKALI